MLEETGSLCCKSTGGSMLPLIRQGRDVVVIRRPAERLKKYDVVLYKRPYAAAGASYVLHRVMKVNPNGTYLIEGDNCVSGEIVGEENILGVLTQVVYKGKNRTEGFGYWLYVHTWIACRPVRVFLLRLKKAAGKFALKTLKTLHIYEPVKKMFFGINN